MGLGLERERVCIKRTPKEFPICAWVKGLRLDIDRESLYNEDTCRIPNMSKNKKGPFGTGTRERVFITRTSEEFPTCPRIKRTIWDWD